MLHLRGNDCDLKLISTYFTSIGSARRRGSRTRNFFFSVDWRTVGDADEPWLAMEVE